MKYISSWLEEETGEWVLEYEMDQEEKERLEFLEKKVVISISEIVECWLRWEIKHPEDATRQMRKWQEER